MVFPASGWPIGLPEGGELKSAKTLDFANGQLAATDNLIVWDRDSNNAAIRLVKDIKDSWSVHASDYAYIGLVKVRVEHEGQPVAAAQITVSDKSRHEDQIIDPSSKGEASFFGFSPGEIKVAVTYRSNGKAMTPWKQGFDISLKRDRAEPLLIVSLTDPVETIAAGTSAKSGKTGATGTDSKDKVKAAVPAKTANPIGSFFVFIGALLVGAGVIYGIMIYIKNNQQQVGDKLKSLGVEMPDPAPQPGDAPPPTAVPAAPAPQQKIILEDSAPEPLAAPVSVPLNAPIMMTSGVPAGARLVRDTGEVITLADGENLVGRDAGLIVSLPGESTVSRRHASLTNVGGSVVVKDLGSTNGTYVNGNKVDLERTLSVGDSVQFGQVHFRFEI